MAKKFHLLLAAEEKLPGKGSRILEEAEIGEYSTEEEVVEAFHDTLEELGMEEETEEEDEEEHV